MMIKQVLFIPSSPIANKLLGGNYIMHKVLLSSLYKMKCQKGLGLIELLLSLTILSLVLALGYTFFFFGTGTFDTGEDQQNVQQNVRNLASVITDEIRFATDVHILGAGESIPINDGKYYIFVENGEVYFQDDSGTQSLMPVIIDDGTVIDSILFSGVGSNILEFTISAHKDQQNYQVESSLEPLNLTDSITGVDNGVAIGFRKQDIRMTASPNEITTGTYTDLSIRLDLVNCQLTTSNINIGNIDLDGVFSGLTLDSATKNSSNQFVVTFEDSTSINSSGLGSITIHHDSLDISNDLTVHVIVSDPVESFITIDGEGFISIPESGDVSETYTATVRDQQGYEIVGSNVSWGLTGEGTGVTIDNNGVVRVTSSADMGTFTVVATSGSISGTLDVELLPADLEPPNIVSVAEIPGNKREVTVEYLAGARLEVQSKTHPNTTWQHEFESSENYTFEVNNLNRFPLRARLISVENDDIASIWITIESTATGNGDNGNGGTTTLCGDKSTYEQEHSHGYIRVTARNEDGDILTDLILGHDYWSLDPVNVHNNTDLSIINIGIEDDKYKIEVADLKNNDEIEVKYDGILITKN